VAFEVARKRNGKLCSVDKANVLEVCVCVCVCVLISALRTIFVLWLILVFHFVF
jgi:hypothetical protein